MLAVLLGGQLMALIDAFVVNVAMPSIGADLHASGAALQLVVGGYSAAYAMLLITGARLGEEYGRRRMYLLGVVTMGVFGFLYFGMVDTAIPALVFIAIVLSLIPHDMQYGPQAALIAESFTPNLRYSGASLGYQLASIIAGGPAPLIATWLFASYHSGYAISVYIAVLAVISFIATWLMPDYTGKDISDDAYSED